MDDPEWWKKNPSPQHPDWGLQDISDLDHAKLKLHIDQDENAEREMPIEVNIYRAALEYLDGKGTLFNRSRDSPTKALDFLQQAEDMVTSGESEEAITGYGVVINTFRMWLRPDSSVEATLKELEEKKTQFPQIIQLAVGFTTDGDHIMTVPPSSLDKTNHRCLTTLENYSKQSGGDSNVTCQAQLKLANANLLLGKIDEARTQYDNLYKPPPVEVIFGRGKCYVKTGIQSNESDCKAWATAIQMAEELDARNSSILSDELYADVYLAKAKFITGGESAELLKRAIQKNSLEACYRYILSLQELQTNFFNDISIPETLQDVKRVCSVGKPLHTQFTVELDDDSKVVPNLTTKKNFIRTAVDRVVNYDINITQTIENERLQTVVDKLRQLRECRMKYELELRRSRENNEWGEEYKGKFLDVVEQAKGLLDKCISACQDLVMDNPPRFSLFQVVFDGKTGNLDKERCTKEVTSWAKKKVKLPEYLLEKIAEIQPMNDKTNMWLWAIHNLENWRKHSAERCDIGETYTIKVDSDSEFATLKTEDIVKDSCKGVVNLVVDLLNTCCEKSSEASTVAGDV
ncbi:uncharacterized protein [Apostichopus japonicus]